MDGIVVAFFGLNLTTVVPMQGLINALTTVVPNAEHKFCVMHLYRNMYKDHKGVGSRTLLWLAARSTTEFMFKKHMSELKKVVDLLVNCL